MRVNIYNSVLKGDILAPSSKSITHRVLIASALSRKKCTISNIVYSDDINATIDCLQQLNCLIVKNENSIEINGEKLFEKIHGVLDCRESGSTLRFLIPVALLANKIIKFTGSKRLLQRPLDDYYQLAKSYNYLFVKDGNELIVKGKLTCGNYFLYGNSSSQFTTGMILALSSLKGNSKIIIDKNLQSKSYIDLTCSVIKKYQISADFIDNIVSIKSNGYIGTDMEIEADMSNSAYLDCYNYIGGNVNILNQPKDSSQGDRIFKKLFSKLNDYNPVIDIADCPDLAPILISLAALKNGAVLNNTARLALKESDRAEAMKEELKKFGINIIVEPNRIIINKTELNKPNEIINSHNDHRIVMAMTFLLTITSGSIEQAEAVNKSFPNYFEILKKLGCKFEIESR